MDALCLLQQVVSVRAKHTRKSLKTLKCGVSSLYDTILFTSQMW